MGCHTWCAYKENRSIEEARRLWIVMHEEFTTELKEIISNTDENCLAALGWTVEYIEQSIRVRDRQLRMVKSGLCNVAVMNKQPEHSYYIEDRGFFINSEEHGNQFRISGYPNDDIFSKEECMQFIERNKDKISFNDNTYKQLDEFWDRYPDGYMHFG